MRALGASRGRVDQADDRVEEHQDHEAPEPDDVLALSAFVRNRAVKALSQTERLVLGDPALVGAVLQRLEDGAVSAVDLVTWRAYRDGKVLSLALLRGPGELAEQTPHPMAQMAATIYICMPMVGVSPTNMPMAAPQLT